MNDNISPTERIMIARLDEHERIARHRYPTKSRPSGRHSFATTLRRFADRIDG